MKLCLLLVLAVGCILDDAASHEHVVRRVAKHGRFDLNLLIHRFENCRSNPESCGDATDDSGDFGNDMQDKVIDDLNESQGILDNSSFDFEACDSHRADADSYRSSFSQKVIVHTQCREMQIKDDSALHTCDQLQRSNEQFKDAECNNDKLTESADDMADICTPSNGEILGSWLKSMKNSFTTKFNEWHVQEQKCTGAIWQLGNSTERCSEVNQNATDQSAECEAILSGIESFACSWATDSGSHCSAYETCFESALQTFNAQVAALPAKIEQWKATWIAAGRLKCMADAIDSSGEVDAAKMEKCNDQTSYDTSHLRVTVPSPPQKEACVVPEIYPGSALFRSEVYKPLPVGVHVRDPTLCLSWKGGCAAYSTFAGSLVHLKYNGKYCHLLDSEMVCDGSHQEEFIFHHPSGDGCSGKVSLSTSDQVACKYNPIPTDSSTVVSVQCGGTGGVDIPAWARISSNPPATGRTGEVSLSFDAVESSFKVISMQYWGSQSTVWVPSSVQCHGALQAMTTTFWQAKNDRVFQYRCSTARWGTFISSYWSSYTYLQAGWFVRCPPNMVISAVESKFVKQFGDRQYKFGCSTLPVGMSMQTTNVRGKTFGEYQRFRTGTTSDCSDAQVLMGMYRLGYRSGFAALCGTITAKQPPSLTFGVEYASATL